MVDYEEYLNSESWQKKREMVLTFWNHSCSICHSSINLHIHHRTYDRLGGELITDLLVLCEECHDLYHSNGRLKTRKRARRRSMTLYEFAKSLEGKTYQEKLQAIRVADSGGK